MKRFVLKIVLFVALFAIIYLPAVRLLGGTPLGGNISWVPNNYGHLHSRIGDIRNYHDVDVLFLGSSHCYRTFDTRIYDAAGIRAFNLGSSNQTPVQTLALLQRYLDSLNPGRVVFEVHPAIMKNDGVESAVDLLSNCPVDCNISRMALRLHNPRTLNSWFYAMMRRKPIPEEDSVITVGTTFNGESVMTDFAYVSGGFVELPCWCYRPKPVSTKNIEINPVQTEALQRCLALLQQRNIPYVLLEVPASKCLYSAYANHREFEDVMSSLGPYVNLNDLTSLTSLLVDSHHYFDEDHLNQAGVEIVNEYLVRCMLLD